jgi:flagellar biosynthesis/type III secretory pathway chaperone
MMMAGPDAFEGFGTNGSGVPNMTGYLEQMTEVYQRLLDLGKRKERCLVDTDLAELEVLVREEQQLVSEAAQLEAKRFRLQLQLTEELNCPGETLTVSRLLETVNADDGRRLLQSQEQLAQVLKRVAEQNELNAALIEQSLAYADFMLRALRETERQTYDPKGQVDDKHGRHPRVLDRRV